MHFFTYKRRAMSAICNTPRPYCYHCIALRDVDANGPTICILHTSPCRMWVGFTFDFHRTPTLQVMNLGWNHITWQKQWCLCWWNVTSCSVYTIQWISGDGDYEFVPLVALWRQRFGEGRKVSWRSKYDRCCNEFYGTCEGIDLSEEPIEENIEICKPSINAGSSYHFLYIPWP